MSDSKSKLETILVCDDDATVLAMVVTILQRANFNVLTASTGKAALEIEKATAGKIDMLLSDVEMPEMSGPDLGREMKSYRSDIRVMLMSGGEQGNLLVLNYGWSYIQKPFVPVKLVEMINDVLHSPDRSQLSNEFDSRKDPKKPPVREYD